MPGHRVMSRRQRRWQGHDEMLLILWIGYRYAGRNCLPTFIFDFHARKFRYHAFAKIQGETLLETSAAGLADSSFG